MIQRIIMGVAWVMRRTMGTSGSELDCAGVGLIMGDAAVVYQGEAFAGDRLVFEVAALPSAVADICI